MYMKVMAINQKMHVQEDERGFASLVIAFVMIIVLGLLSVGYAQLARNEQQSSLGKQLSQQAYYAAESGVNETYHLLSNASFASSVDPTSCVPASDFPTSTETGTDPGIEGESLSNKYDVQITCVLVNTHPSTLSATLTPGQSWNTIFTGTLSDGTPSAVINQLGIYWDTTDGHNTPANIQLTPYGNTVNANTLPTQAAWGTSPPVIQVTLTPLNTSPGAVNRASLINNSLTYYFYPYHGTGTCATPLINPLPQILCSDTSTTGYNYGTTLNNVASYIPGASSNTYLVHVEDYYDAAKIEIGNAVDLNTHPVNFEGSQADVDSTGKAKDVLKRLAEVVPLVQSSTLPTDALDGQNICKEFTTLPDSAGTPAPADPYSEATNPCDTDN
jgi:Tfp pilus assembly protein PilX